MKKINIRLSRREKIIVSAVACLVVLFVFFYFLFFPFFSSRARLRQSVHVDQQRLKEVMALSAEYQCLQKNSGGINAALAKREKGFTLFSLLEGLASEAGLKDRIKYIKPSATQIKGKYKTSSVEMQFEAINMPQLFDYLYRVEDPKNVVRIKRISVKKHKEKTGYVDATLQVSTVEPA